MNMFRVLKLNCALFVALMVWGLPVWGQAEAAPEAEAPPEPQVDVHFSIYVWPVSGILHEGSDVPGVPRVFYEAEDGMRQVPLARNASSALMRYRGPLPLELFDAERVEVPPPEDAPPGTEPTYTYRKFPVASVNFPEDWSQVLLVMFPGQTDPDGGTRTLPMRYDLDRVRPGHVRIYNTTDENFVGEVEEEQFTIRAHAPLDFRPRGASGHHAFRMNFYGRDRSGDTRLRYTTRVVARETTSNFYLLYKVDSRRLRLMRVGGHEAPPTPTPEPTPEPSPGGQGRQPRQNW